MKRWIITRDDQTHICSLLGFTGTAKVATVRSGDGDIIHFQFMKKFDFARAKESIEQTGWCMLPGEEVKLRTKIIFK